MQRGAVAVTTGNLLRCADKVLSECGQLDFGGLKHTGDIRAAVAEIRRARLEFDAIVLHTDEYEDFDTALRLDTDGQGLLTFNPFAGSPLLIGRDHSSSGRGHAVDFGLGVVADRVEVGFGVKGLSNRIEWTDVERTTHALSNLFLGGGFFETPDVPLPDVTVELPRDYRGYAGFRTGSGTVVGDFGHQGTDPGVELLLRQFLGQLVNTRFPEAVADAVGQSLAHNWLSFLWIASACSSSPL